MSTVSVNRKQACIDLVYSTARALQLTQAWIRSWNKRSQYVYDENGCRVVLKQNKGGGCKRRRTQPDACGMMLSEWQQEEADSHITCDFFEPQTQTLYTAHVYTVDDEEDVPQRLMLLHERRFTKPWDDQSPQLWRGEQIGGLEEGTSTDTTMTSTFEEVLDRHLTYTLKRHVGNQVNFFMYWGIMGLDLTRAGFSQVALSEIQDEELVEFGFCSEMIGILRRHCRGVWIPSFENEQLGMVCPPVKLQLLMMFFQTPEVKALMDEILERKYLEMD